MNRVKEVGISDTYQKEIRRTSPVKNFRPGALVFARGTPAKTLYYVSAGSVAVYAFRSDVFEGAEDSIEITKNVLVGYIGVGGLAGIEMIQQASTGEQVNYQVTLIARGDCQLVPVKASSVLYLMNHYPQFALDVTTQLLSDARVAQQRLVDLFNLNVYTRLLRALEYMATLPDAKTHPDGMVIKVTRQTLGTMIGASREMVGRSVKMLEDAGKLTAKGSTFVIFCERKLFNGASVVKPNRSVDTAGPIRMSAI
jgi:CRP/FNR family cyclic AMP-dependent transcriptional regulator